MPAQYFFAKGVTYRSEGTDMQAATAQRKRALSKLPLDCCSNLIDNKHFVTLSNEEKYESS